MLEGIVSELFGLMDFIPGLVFGNVFSAYISRSRRLGDGVFKLF